MEGLEGAIAITRKALARSRHGHPHISLNDLADLLHVRFNESGKMEDLEEAISSYREVLTFLPHGHPARFSSNLPNALLSRFGQSGRMEDLEEAISMHREALAHRPHGHPGRAMSLRYLASALRTRFHRSGRIEDLEEAILMHRDALAFRPHGHPDRAISLESLANALNTRFNQSGKMEDLEDAISSHREAFSLRPRGHPDRSMSLNNLASALHTRFQQSGRMEDLEEAISTHREALTLFPHGHPDRSKSLSNLSNALRTRFDQSGRIEDLEEAISTYREALTLLPHGHPDRATSLESLANALRTRYQQLGKMEDLDNAISTHRDGLTLLPHGHPPHFSSNLPRALLTRFHQLNRMEDLEEAISFHREALALCPHGNPDRSSFLAGLADSLATQFDQLNRMEDLEGAISTYREALTLRPHGHPRRYISLNNLADILHTRFKHSGGTEDLEDAISLHREALTLLPHDHPHRSSSNLPRALLSRFEQSGRIEDLEDAISIHREALALRPHGHPQRSWFLNNFADALHTRFNQSGRKEDLEDAISALHEILTLLPHGHPHRSASLCNLAKTLLSRFKQSNRMEDLGESFALYRRAANDSTSHSRGQLDAALDWVANARFYNHESIISAYSASLRLLDRCLNLHPNVASQHKFLTSARTLKSLASDAASAAIDAGDLKAGVELLEQGRTILWSRMALTVELERLSLSSANSRTLDGERTMEPAHFEAKIRRNRILSEDLEETLRKVREIEGFGDFLQAVPFKTLQAAAAEGPVILVNISGYRSDAIILHNAVDDLPIHVTLPKVYGDLLDLTLQLVQTQNLDAGADRSKNIFPILRDLWHNIVSPVVDRLTELGTPEKSRVWWCPTSTLCVLPLHAAGLYDGKHKNLPDLYTSSYTPTLSALIRARANTGYSQSVVPKLLVIGQPGKSLPNVQTEIDNIQQLGDFVDVIVGTEANRDRVLQGLQHHSWAHFACHGHRGDMDQPFEASFELHGGHSLSLLDLIQARLPNAELAFLSACHSAEGNIATPDETIHLAAALQFCGFRSVVGTLWAMDDRDGPVISREFYKHMFRNQGPGNFKADFRDSAEALGVAVRALRKSRVPLERWILFVHIGA